MFEFLAPAFAAVGALAASVPIVLHLLRRSPSQKIPFSVVQFLRPTLPKITRRSTIEHWPLMLLRILALALIALAFGRPFQYSAATADDTEDNTVRRIAVLIDSSASMRRDGIREAVEERLREIGDTLEVHDVLSVSEFDREVRPVITADEWAASEPSVRDQLLESVLAEWEPTWDATRTGAALLSAAEEVAEERQGEAAPTERRVILITDFQRGSVLDELQTSSFPAGVAVELQVVDATDAGNAGVHMAQDDRDGRLRVRVISSGDAQRGEYRLQPFDVSGAAVGQPVPVALAAGQRRTILISTAEESTESVIAGVELLDDPHPFDNVIDVPVTDIPVTPIAFHGSADPNDASRMRYYLQRVIDGSDQSPMRLVDLVQPGDVVVPVPEDVRLICVTEPLPGGLIASVRDCLERGGTLFVVAASAETVMSVTPLLPEPLTVEEAEVADYAMFGQIDFQHPLFRVLSDVRFSDLSSVRFWKYRRLSPPDDSEAWSVIAAFDSGDPALLQARTQNGGRVIVSASGWHPDDSQWALSTRFPPIISRLVQLAHPRSSAQLMHTVGDRIDPVAVIGSADWELSDSVNTVVRSSAGEASGEATGPSGIVLDRPGRFQLTGTRNGEPVAWAVIVGLDLSESRTEPYPLGQLQALGLDADISSTGPQAAVDADPRDPEVSGEQLRASELEWRQKLWRWCLLGALACLLLESTLAGRIEKREALSGPET